MPSLIDLRRRIRAIKSTQQITRAMKTVAASKLRRAQERIFGARPFAQRMLQVLNSLAARVDPSAHPLLAQRREQGRVLLIVITADRGLCGSFNSNIVRRAGAVVVESADRQIALGLVGRKGRDYFRRHGFDVWYELVGIFNQLRYGHAQELARVAIERFTSGDSDAVYLVYNEFKSVLQQRVVIERLLPIVKLDLGEETAPSAGVDYLYEPAPEQIFKELLPRHVEVQIYRALLESSAAEHAARMTAMDAASKNSAEMIEQLTLYMNKVRQAAITREIIEVISGAEAL
ncbi:MAG: ATP synthase F1 subunit gamma [Acidobacteria bacterium]|nr:ATP synthase F1 subunit gamma [Acidobacteriota bacterium]